MKTFLRISGAFLIICAIAGCSTLGQNNVVMKGTLSEVEADSPAEEQDTAVAKIIFNHNGVEKSLVLYSPDSLDSVADRFVTLKGRAEDPENRDYALVTVNKTGENHPYYRYLVQGEFVQKIWFRYGKGNYTVKLYSIVGNPLVFKDYKDEFGNICEGDISIVCGTSEQYKIELSLFNTSDEKSADTPDCRFLYPSYEIQSDNPRIVALSNSVCAGSNTDEEKLSAIHEFILKNISYDYSSTGGSSRRKKQDALSVLDNKEAVCEGYAKLFAAFARAQGIPAAFMEGKAWNSQHAWNNVRVGGTWKLIDAAQNDAKSYTEYFLKSLDSFRGINGNHDGTSGDDFYEDDSFFPVLP